ncbi:MAG TPA: hypothetical protein VKY74_02330 [Chloroflexia bacterium]|nr:hypothetical protein [Chloroflexia bacterium]
MGECLGGLLAVLLLLLILALAVAKIITLLQGPVPRSGPASSPARQRAAYREALRQEERPASVVKKPPGYHHAEPLPGGSVPYEGGRVNCTAFDKHGRPIGFLNLPQAEMAPPAPKPRPKAPPGSKRP